MKIQIDTYTRVLLTVIAVLLTVLAAGMWLGTPDTTSVAGAAERGLPDMSGQLNQITTELQTLNATNSQILAALQGELKVMVVDAMGQPVPAPQDQK